jgi:hypothetical protein
VGLELTQPELELMHDGVIDNLRSFEPMRARPLANGVPTALVFDPLAALGRPPEADAPYAFGEDGKPTSVSFSGGLGEDERLLAFAQRLHGRTDWHLRHPADQPGRRLPELERAARRSARTQKPRGGRGEGRRGDAAR